MWQPLDPVTTFAEEVEGRRARQPGSSSLSVDAERSFWKRYTASPLSLAERSQKDKLCHLALSCPPATISMPPRAEPTQGRWVATGIPEDLGQEKPAASEGHTAGGGPSANPKCCVTASNCEILLRPLGFVSSIVMTSGIAGVSRVQS